MSSDQAIEHDRWKDVTDQTGFNYHWHHVDPPEDSYRSIRLSKERFAGGLGGYSTGWSVELYPDPDNDGQMTRWYFDPDEYDDPEQAARDKVREVMEEYA